jgi:hypothetical protein
VSKSKPKGDDDVSETKEKGNDVAETIKRLPTDRLEELQKAVHAELKTRDGSEERQAEEEKLSKLSDSAFKQLVVDLMDSKPSKKSDEE